MRFYLLYEGSKIYSRRCSGDPLPWWYYTPDQHFKRGNKQRVPDWQPGEFTKEAFLNGRIDLVQAEAVMDLICAKRLKNWLRHPLTKWREVYLLI